MWNWVFWFVTLNGILWVILRFISWLKLRKLNGPTRWIPFAGNNVSLSLDVTHRTIGSWVSKFGPVFEVHATEGKRIVVTSETDVLSKTLTSKGLRHSAVFESLLDRKLSEDSLSIDLSDIESDEHLTLLHRRWELMSGALERQYHGGKDIGPLALHAVNCCISLYGTPSKDNIELMGGYAIGVATALYILTPAQRGDWHIGSTAYTDTAHLANFHALAEPLLPVLFTTLHRAMAVVKKATRPVTALSQLLGSTTITRADRTAFSELRGLIQDHLSRVICGRIEGRVPLLHALLTVTRDDASPGDTAYTIAELTDASMDLLVSSMCYGGKLLGQCMKVLQLESFVEQCASGDGGVADARLRARQAWTAALSVVSPGDVGVGCVVHDSPPEHWQLVSGERIAIPYPHLKGEDVRQLYATRHPVTHWLYDGSDGAVGGRREDATLGTLLYASFPPIFLDCLITQLDTELGPVSDDDVKSS